MSYGKLQANLSGQSSESGNLATFTLSITSTVRRPNFQTPVLSQGATIWSNVSDMVNLNSVEHPQPHFMKINFLAFIVILPYIWLSYNTVDPLGPPLGPHLGVDSLFCSTCVPDNDVIMLPYQSEMCPIFNFVSLQQGPE